jgi:hypothetical protein
MSLAAGWIALAAVLALLLGLWLMRAGRGLRLRLGLGGGTTVSLDRITSVGGRGADSGPAGAWAMPPLRPAGSVRPGEGLSWLAQSLG